MTSARPIQVDRGDIIELTLEPTEGQRGRRRVLVLSPREFNRVAGVVFIAPITQGGDYARDMGFTVPLSGTGLDSQGLVLCHQTTSKDINAREPRKIERAPDYIVNDVLARVRAVLEESAIGECVGDSEVHRARLTTFGARHYGAR